MLMEFGIVCAGAWCAAFHVNSVSGSVGADGLHPGCHYGAEKVWRPTSWQRVHRNTPRNWNWGADICHCLVFGQRNRFALRFTGSPPRQVFVGKIPRDLYEDELVPLFESAGAIWDLRLMMDPLSGQNRGYAFITYCNKDDAQKAVKLVSGHQGCRRQLKVVLF